MTQISASSPARFVVIGGDKLDGHRFVWWNFVSSRRKRIVRAGEDWTAQKMGQVAGDPEFIPLPERKFQPAEVGTRAPYL